VIDACADEDFDTYPPALVCLKNGTRQGQNSALTVLFVPNSALTVLFGPRANEDFDTYPRARPIFFFFISLKSRVE